MPDSFFPVIYTISLIVLSLYGLNALLLSLVFLFVRRHPQVELPPTPAAWPKVTVQLPIYNERFVVERLIQATSALEYPPEALSIQVLDDSTDETLALTEQLVAEYQARGVNISLLHRTDRTGYKAGALQAGLQEAEGDMLAIFDADFVPPSNFLKRLVPYLAADPRLGMIQARWGHLNDTYNWLTRAQSLYLDAHFLVEQVSRSRAGLCFNFNGSAGIWRRECIEDAGGWQGDTLSEDLDLSYRAQMRGWRFVFLPEVIAPAEIPPQVAAFKQQQYRWSRGSIQVLLKLWPRIWVSRLSLLKRLQATIHLSGYITHPLMMVILLTSLPVVLNHGRGVLPLPWLALAGLGPPLLFALSQWSAYPNWTLRFLYFPILLTLGIGVAFNDSLAVLAAFRRNSNAPFVRTPKFHLETRQDQWNEKKYRLPIHWTVWAELLMAGYAFFTAWVAIRNYPDMLPLLLLYGIGLAQVGLQGLFEGIQAARPA